MPESHQLTLDLADRTALASGWTLEVPRAIVRIDESVEVPTCATTGEAPFAESSDASAPAPEQLSRNFYLPGDRNLARTWLDRARDNIAAIQLAARTEREGRPATPEEQARLIRFTGFGASDLANGCFRRPGDSSFRAGWEAIGEALEEAVAPGDYASLARCTQYAHYTPEFVVRAIWGALERMGFRGGSILEPGVGTGLFLSLLPEPLRARTRFTGIELDAVTARIAQLLSPEARIRHEDFAKSTLPASFDLAIGNPPFSDRIVRRDPRYRALAFRLHDFFIAKAIDLVKPGGLAAFVTSHGTMDKADTRARAHIAATADLIGAIRLPEGSFRAAAGTDVVVDLLFFRRRRPGEVPRGTPWETLAEVRPADGDSGPIRVNSYFAEHPETVLGEHGLRRGIYGPAETYTCRPRAGVVLEDVLARAIERLPADVYEGEPEPIDGPVPDDTVELPPVGTADDGATIREGSYVIGADGALMQILDGAAQPVAIKRTRGGEGIFGKHARLIRALIPIRDAVRAVLRAQEADQPWTNAQVRLRVAYATFVRSFGPINLTRISTAVDAEMGEGTETHRRPNLQPFLDDPDCWLVASIEDYDLETGTAKLGPVFSERVIAPPQSPVIASAADALAVVLNERGRVDLDHVAELLHRDRESVLAELGEAVFRNPVTESWETADEYLSGAVRSKLAAAEGAAARDPAYLRNVTALRRVQPADIRPSDITARLGAPWIPCDVIEAFAAEVMGTETRVRHTPDIASWSVDSWRFEHSVAGRTDWGTHRRHAGLLLSDALNASIPQIYDTIDDEGTERRVLNTEATEAAKEKLAKIKAAFQSWVWSCADRTDRLARLYNDRFNNLLPRHFDGSHLNLPGASSTFRLYDHQKRAIWRIVAAGSTYIAHAVGAGKTLSIAAAIMEQKRLGLIAKALLVVPGHCLAQASREFLALYPNARLLVADETNFVREKRQRFLARAATTTWDAIIITHSAFRFIPVPAAFERQLIQDQLDAYEALLGKIDRDDRLTRKRIERLKEGYQARLEALACRKDDLLTLGEIGIDQIIVDEAQEFRKLSFATNMTGLRGVDPQGSQRAWDLLVKARFIASKRRSPEYGAGQAGPCRALILSSGTPITNTLGEMFSLQRFLQPDALVERGVHEFDAWASAFGDTRTELELQPSGRYRAVTRFAEFVNLPELIVLFRSVADVVQPADLRQLLRVPAVKGGTRRIVTAEPSPAFRAYQAELDARIRAIEQRNGPPQPGDDILLSVITDGRHAAIDLRLVLPGHADEPKNKLNALITRVHAIWRETAERRYARPDGRAFERPGAGQLIFSDLGTIAVESVRGFSCYRWIRDSLVRLGVPAAEIAVMQDHRKSEAKQRLFNAFNAGRVRILIGSSETMGTGVNLQQRLVALHHLDVPWLPSQIEQREGRILRQANQNDEVEIYAYATLGSLDATLWQSNERKARFIAAALSGDRSIRRLEDLEGQANQFALAKAIASGDSRLMQKAGLEAEIARLERLRAAHVDEQHAIRREIRDLRAEVTHADTRIAAVREDLARHRPTGGAAFEMTVNGRTYAERGAAGRALMQLMMELVQSRAEGERLIATIGGFDLSYHGRRYALGKHHHDVALLRTRFEQEVELPVTLTPLGAIARLEHILAGFTSELELHQRRREAARSRLAGFEPRLGEVFAFEGELELKRRELAEIEAALAATAEAPKGGRSGSAGTRTGKGKREAA